MRQAHLPRVAPRAVSRAAGGQASPRLALLFADSDDGLRECARTCHPSLAAGLEGNTGQPEVAWRHQHGDRYRAAFVFASGSELRRQLDAFARGSSRPGISYGQVLPARERQTALVFTGHGGQHWKMGAGLLRGEPAFRDVIERCDAVVRRTAGWSLTGQLYGGEHGSRLTRPEMRVSQVALFALQAGLAALLQARGLEPSATLGHSSGEIAAAYAAGALDLDVATELACTRGDLMQRLADSAPGRGAMAAVQLDPAMAAGYLQGRELSLAAVNGPRWVTFSGDVAAIDELAAELGRQQIACRTLRVPVAAHTSQVDGIRAELESRLAGMNASRPHLAMYSTVTGSLLESVPDAGYWGSNLRHRVLFADAVTAALANGIRTFVELGPHPALGPAIGDCISAAGVPGSVLASLARDRADHRAMLSAFSALHVQGQPITWKEQEPMSDITAEQKQEVKEIICEVLELEPDELSETSHFTEDYGADSLRAIEILANLERALGVTIEQEELSRMTTLQNVYAVVSEASARVAG
ncbi:MAG TPA: acyltransferase domain-containing protein [Streptosporangiaceae bacterium]|jgi:polyketide synthase 12